MESNALSGRSVQYFYGQWRLHCLFKYTGRLPALEAFATLDNGVIVFQFMPVLGCDAMITLANAFNLEVKQD